jgi:hypothetical protein
VRCTSRSRSRSCPSRPCPARAGRA